MMMMSVTMMKRNILKIRKKYIREKIIKIHRRSLQVKADVTKKRKGQHYLRQNHDTIIMKMMMRTIILRRRIKETKPRSL